MNDAPAQTRQFQTTAISRAGMGQPLPKMEPITSALPEQDELLWDDGAGIYNEECIDNWTHLVTPWQALGMWSAGLSVFGLVAYAAKLNDKASKVPHVPKEFPFGGLETELGGLPTRPNSY
eukprot:CAMPEP_0118931990 /NCGR_PEP_ID=MMETSP1169-20130426/8900_1 /TAXON_ID=36882 /ORGANISM="Pyramimonas obovata, Strain CCMP722" /LENGTH=120 /DNA_ID=CAMNT_0006874573 /DNA_START=151 /DNA_END=513 /DNA_ORIENTATION=+